MIRFKPLPLMSIFAILAFAVLLMAGRWQWEKYETKIAAADEPANEMTIASYQPIEGGIQFVHGVRPDTREAGWRVFAPVQEGETIIFVDSDFIVSIASPNPNEVRFPASLRFGAAITGASITPSEPAPFTLPPRPLQRQWFAVDLPAMGRNAGLENVAGYYIAGAYVGADGRAAPNPFTHGDALPPERHLGYALTWYGLALVLLGIYFAYHISVGRLAFQRPRPRED